MKAVLPALARPLLEPRLPRDLIVTWFVGPEDAVAAVADAEIAWVDMQDPIATADAVAAGSKLKWVSTIYAGIDAWDKDRLRAAGTMVTNGRGINALAVAEYAVMAVLVAAKRFDTVVRLTDQRQWTTDAPGKIELAGSAALIVGYGAIGRLIGERLSPFGVDVTPVTRSGRDGTLAASEWIPKIGEFDWIILAAPSTAETHALIGADEFTAMKSSAWLINMARGDMIDQPALVDALQKRRIAGAFLDTVTPEPLPADHPLWTEPNAILSMHLSARSQTAMYQRTATLFLENLEAFRAGRPLKNVVDLSAGY